MLNSSSSTACRAKNRNSCRFHGAENRMQNAIKTSNPTAYFDAANELEALQKSDWIEGEWGFTRPSNREIVSLQEIEELLASKNVIADSYTAVFEYGHAMRPRLVRHSAKKAGIAFIEKKTPVYVQFQFIAYSKKDLRFLKDLLEHNRAMLEEDQEQAQYLKTQHLSKQKAIKS